MVFIMHKDESVQFKKIIIGSTQFIKEEKNTGGEGEGGEE